MKWLGSTDVRDRVPTPESKSNGGWRISLGFTVSKDFKCFSPCSISSSKLALTGTLKYPSEVYVLKVWSPACGIRSSGGTAEASWDKDRSQGCAYERDTGTLPSFCLLLHSLPYCEQIYFVTHSHHDVLGCHRPKATGQATMSRTLSKHGTNKPFLFQLDSSLVLENYATQACEE